jgi:hypothetical protein
VPGGEWLRGYRRGDLFVGMKGPIRDLVARGGWPQRYGRQIAYLSIEQAWRETGIQLDHPSPTR